MVWHGASRTQGGKALLTDDQWLMLAKLAKDSEYWKTANNFMKGIRGHELTSLSVKQLDWYYTIEARLDVEINKQTAREVFNNEQPNKERPNEAIGSPRQGGKLHYE